MRAKVFCRLNFHRHGIKDNQIEHQCQVSIFLFCRQTKPIVWKLDGHPPKNSINYLFGLAKYKNYIFNLTDLPNTSILYKHLHTQRPLFGVGDFFSASNPDIHYQEDRIINLVTAYDIIIYFSDTNPITIKKKENPRE
jgi:hypothetical protein